MGGPRRPVNPSAPPAGLAGPRVAEQRGDGPAPADPRRGRPARVPQQALAARLATGSAAALPYACRVLDLPATLFVPHVVPVIVPQLAAQFSIVSPRAAALTLREMAWALGAGLLPCALLPAGGPALRARGLQRHLGGHRGRGPAGLLPGRGLHQHAATPARQLLRPPARAPLPCGDPSAGATVAWTGLEPAPRFRTGGCAGARASLAAPGGGAGPGSRPAARAARGGAPPGGGDCTVAHRRYCAARSASQSSTTWPSGSVR